MSSNYTVFLHSPKTGLPQNVFYLPFSTSFINSHMKWESMLIKEGDFPWF